jgi:ribose transport system permease protein
MSVPISPLIGLLCVAAVFAVLTGAPERYLSLQNLRVILAQTLIDLSVGSVIALTSVVCAVLLRAGWSPGTGIAGAAIVGALVGLANGVMITALRVVPFIATLGMLGIARGLAKWLAGERSVDIPETWLNQLAVTVPDRPWLLVAPAIWMTIVLAATAALVLRQTIFGRRVVAIGSSEPAALAAGIPVARYKLRIYTLGGVLFGFAGAMQTSRLRQGDPTVAIGTELDVIAAVVVGGGSLNGGEGSVAGSIVGALTIAFLRNGSQQMGWPPYTQEIIIGAIIVAAVALDRWRNSRP